MPTIIKKLDATGLLCPLPVLRACKVLAGMSLGEILEIRVTDPNASADFKAFCEETDNKLIKILHFDEIDQISIEKR